MFDTSGPGQVGAKVLMSLAASLHLTLRWRLGDHFPENENRGEEEMWCHVGEGGHIIVSEGGHDIPMKANPLEKTYTRVVGRGEKSHERGSKIVGAI